MFPCQSDDIFKSVNKSHVLSRKSRVSSSVQLPSSSLSVPRVAVRDCNVRKRSVKCNSVSSSKNNVHSISKPVCDNVIPSGSVSSSVSPNVSKSVICNVSHSQCFNSDTPTYIVTNHRNVCRKPKLRNYSKGSLFISKVGSHDIVSGDKTNVTTSSRNFYISLLFLSAIFWEFLLLGIFINNNYYFESNTELFLLKPNDIVYYNHSDFFQTNSSSIFNSFSSFKPFYLFNCLVNLFSYIFII